MSGKKITIKDAALQRATQVLAAPTPCASDLRNEYAALAASYKAVLKKFQKTLAISDNYQAQHQEAKNKLEETTAKYRQLRDVALPICMYCKKIRSDNDYWQKLETFFCNHVDIMFSHGICPDCIKTAYRKMGIKKSTLSPTGQICSEKTIPSVIRAQSEDDALKEMREVVRQRAFDGNPVAPQIDQFVEQYGKLLRRFNKIVAISDNYESQLMELKSQQELLARTDLLTGLANRWEMAARLEEEKSRAERHGKTFSILIADIDHFKKVNDDYGHLGGDRVLRALAETFNAHVRKEDVCCRWGGEEFLFILPETNLINTKLFAEKILSEVRKMVVLWEDREIQLTLSVGYGLFIPGNDIDKCIKEIDDALAKAKLAGRDRAVAAEE